MLTDASLLLSNLQAITSTAASTNVIDYTTQSDIGIGVTELQFAIYVGTTFTASGSATLQVQVQGSADNSTFYTITETDALPVADLVANAEIPIDLTRRSLVQTTPALLPRYYRLNYVVATGPMTAGTLSAYLVIDRDEGITMGQYKSGFTVGN